MKAEEFFTEPIHESSDVDVTAALTVESAKRLIAGTGTTVITKGIGKLITHSQIRRTDERVKWLKAAFESLKNTFINIYGAESIVGFMECDLEGKTKVTDYICFDISVYNDDYFRIVLYLKAEIRLFDTDVLGVGI